MIRKWDKIFKWDHPEEAVFSLEDVEKEMKSNGFRIQQKNIRSDSGLMLW